MTINRREWILGSLTVAAYSAVASAQQHAHHAVAAPQSTKFEFFDPATAADITAIASRIVPSEDGPGATEAGAVYFIDRALRTFAADQQDAYRTGLADLNQKRKAQFPASTSFATLPESQQTSLLKSIETTDFFNTVRTHTILAWLGNPSYGGNRNAVGWKYIGFDDAGYFESPFGYYDAEGK